MDGGRILTVDEEEVRGRLYAFLRRAHGDLSTVEGVIAELEPFVLQFYESWSKANSKQ